jgi:protein ImuA
LRHGGITFGVAEIDNWLGGGLIRGGLHEMFAAEQADAAAMAGFAGLLGLRAAGRRGILWVRQDFLDGQVGEPNPPGLAGLGLDPGRLLLVRVRDVAGLLRAADESVRCPGLGAVLVESWGECGQIDHTASRRLSLAARESGVPVLMLRVAATPAPSAAATRWLVRAAPSRPLAAHAPGPPAFTLTLLRQRGGAAGNIWHLEWNRERACFQERDASLPSLLRPVVPVPVGRAADPGTWAADRHTG